MDMEIRNMMSAEWGNWKKCSEVLSDRKMPAKLKMKIYRTVVRSAFGYRPETLSTTKIKENITEVNEMRMLRWMSGVREKDTITNEHVRGSVNEAPVTK